MKLLNVSTLLLLLSMQFSALAMATDNIGRIPPLDPPAGFSPYADINKVLSAIDEVLKVLATAKFEGEPNTTSLKKVDKEKAEAENEPVCKEEKFRSIVRGMMLFRSAYSMLANRLENGFISVHAPGDDSTFATYIGGYSKGLFIHSMPLSSIKKVISIADKVSQLPQAIRNDMAAFLKELLIFRKYHASLQKRGELGTFFFLYGGPSSNAYPRASFSIESARMINKNRDIGLPKVDQCLTIQTFGPLTFGLDKEIVIPEFSTWTSYKMLSFWNRRKAEGSSQLADFTIRRVLTSLKNQSAFPAISTAIPKSASAPQEAK